jgi:hypothetical protein
MDFLEISFLQFHTYLADVLRSVKSIIIDPKKELKINHRGLTAKKKGQPMALPLYIKILNISLLATIPNFSSFIDNCLKIVIWLLTKIWKGSKHNKKSYF